MFKHNSITSVVDFMERLYGFRGTLTQSECGQSLFNSGLVTYWNMRTVLHESKSPQKTTDQLRRLNQRRLLLLLGHVKDIPKKCLYLSAYTYNGPTRKHKKHVSQSLIWIISRFTLEYNIQTGISELIINL